MVAVRTAVLDRSARGLQRKGQQASRSCAREASRRRPWASLHVNPLFRAGGSTAASAGGAPACSYGRSVNTNPMLELPAGLVVTQVAEGVFSARTRLTGWTVLTDGIDVALIDCGYPRDLARVRASVRFAAGSSRPVGTLLVTHAHADHIGTASQLVDQDRTQVLCARSEMAGVRRQVHHQVGVKDILRHPRPRVLRWALAAIMAGGMREVAASAPMPLGTSMFCVAGHDVVPIELPGHTPGHLAFWLPQSRVLVTGDALVTDHPTSPRVGAQLLHPMFHHDPARTRASLGALTCLPARVIVPGHGAPMDVDNLAAVVRRTQSAALGFQFDARLRYPTM